MILRLLALVVVLFGCSSTTVSSSDDGHHKIQCINSVGDCHDKARSICPDGYLVTNRVRPVKTDGDDTRYTLNVKCRQAAFY